MKMSEPHIVPLAPQALSLSSENTLQPTSTSNATGLVVCTTRVDLSVKNASQYTTAPSA